MVVRDLRRDTPVLVLPAYPGGDGDLRVERAFLGVAVRGITGDRREFRRRPAGCARG
jgi:hypothetical protein